jgi:hypothetical protein
MAAGQLRVRQTTSATQPSQERCEIALQEIALFCHETPQLPRDERMLKAELAECSAVLLSRGAWHVERPEVAGLNASMYAATMLATVRLLQRFLPRGARIVLKPIFAWGPKPRDECAKGENAWAIERNDKIRSLNAALANVARTTRIPLLGVTPDRLFTMTLAFACLHVSDDPVHWCHFSDHESAALEATAQLLSAHLCATRSMSMSIQQTANLSSRHVPYL